jgi:SprT protein
MKISQLDFFRKLVTWTRTEPPKTAAPPPLSGRNSAPRAGADIGVWQELAENLLQKLGYLDLAARVRIKWNSRMRSTAGTAYPGQALVNLNPRLREFGNAEVDRTLRHELAHLVAQYRAGKKRIEPHGAKWQQACRDLGLRDEKRCHTLPLPQQRLPRPHRYRCPRCGDVIDRARPMRRKVACLACCRKHNRGEYDERFRLVKERLVEK